MCGGGGGREGGTIHKKGNYAHSSVRMISHCSKEYIVLCMFVTGNAFLYSIILYNVSLTLSYSVKV